MVCPRFTYHSPFYLFPLMATTFLQLGSMMFSLKSIVGSQYQISDYDIFTKISFAPIRDDETFTEGFMVLKSKYLRWMRASLSTSSESSFSFFYRFEFTLDDVSSPEITAIILKCDVWKAARYLNHSAYCATKRCELYFPFSNGIFT